MFSILFTLFTAFAEPEAGLPSEECAEEAPELTSQEPSGEKIYQQICTTCHKADGSGVEDVYPPLLDAELVKGDPKVLAHIILRGLSGEIFVKEKRYASYMSAYGQDLSDKEIQQLILFVQQEFGYPTEKEKATPLSEIEIANIRAQKLRRVKGTKGLNQITEVKEP